MEKVTVQNCNNVLQGGGISVFGVVGSNAFAQITNCAVRNNTANIGAGVYATFADVILKDSAIIGNSGGSGSQGKFGSSLSKSFKVERFSLNFLLWCL